MKRPLSVRDGIQCFVSQSSDAGEQYEVDAFETLYALEADNFWFRSRNRVIQSLCRRFLGKRPLDFLEVGCGTGFVLSGLAPLGYRLAGADLFVEALKYARLRVPNAEFSQIDVRDMPFVEDYDAVGAFDVIEHIDDDAAVLAGIHRALRPQGLLFVSVPQYQFLWGPYDELGHHKRRYSRHDLLQRIREQGFRIEYCGSFLFALFPLLLAVRLLGRLWQTKSEATAESGLRMSPLASRVASMAMRIDEILIERGVQLPFGGSLLVVARKV